MATVEDVIQEINEEIDLPGFSATRILRLINRGMLVIAAGRFREFPEIWEICLPELEAQTGVSTTASVAYCSMPSDYHKKLMWCTTSANDYRIKVLKSLSHLKRIEPKLDKSGAIRWVAVVGSNVYYQRVPSSAETLTLHYFKKPTTLSFGDTISELPDHLAVPLLKHYCLAEMYRVKDQAKPEVENETAPKQFHLNEFRRYLGELAAFIGPYTDDVSRPVDRLEEYYG